MLKSRILNLYKTAKILTGIKNANRDYLILIALSGIGDVCYSLSVVEALKKETGKKLLFVTGQYTLSLRRYYSAIDKTITLTPDEERILKSFFTERPNHYIYNRFSQKISLFYCFPLTEVTYRRLSKNNSNYIDILSETFNIKQRKPTYPKIKKEENFIFPFDNPDKTVIINPYSNSLNFKSNEIFTKIIGSLKAKGYCVYTNISGNQTALHGTSELRCTLDELYLLSKEVKLFVSIRSGITDFCISSAGNFLVLYDNSWNGNFRKAYKLSSWKTESSVYEFDYSDTEQILNIIEKIC